MQAGAAGAADPALLEMLAQHKVDHAKVVAALVNYGCTTVDDLFLMEDDDVEALELTGLLKKKLTLCKDAVAKVAKLSQAKLI